MYVFQLLTVGYNALMALPFHGRKCMLCTVHGSEGVPTKSPFLCQAGGGEGRMKLVAFRAPTLARGAENSEISSFLPAPVKLVRTVVSS